MLDAHPIDHLKLNNGVLSLTWNIFLLSLIQALDSSRAPLIRVSLFSRGQWKPPLWGPGSGTTVELPGYRPKIHGYCRRAKTGQAFHRFLTPVWCSSPNEHVALLHVLSCCREGLKEIYVFFLYLKWRWTLAWGCEKFPLWWTRFNQRTPPQHRHQNYVMRCFQHTMKLKPTWLDSISKDHQ